MKLSYPVVICTPQLLNIFVFYRRDMIRILLKILFIAGVIGGHQIELNDPVKSLDSLEMVVMHSVTKSYIFPMPVTFNFVSQKMPNDKEGESAENVAVVVDIYEKSVSIWAQVSSGFHTYDLSLCTVKC